MKCLLTKNNFVKNLLISLLFYILINVIISEKQAPKINIYKSDKSVKHSLFKERNSLDRISVAPLGIPIKKK